MSENNPPDSTHWFTPTAHKLSAATIAGGLVALACFVYGLVFEPRTVAPEIAAAVTGFLTQFVSWALPDAWEAD